MTVYYNENNPYCAQWLHNLVAADLIPAGRVDERSILNIRPHELRDYSQCHLFTGIGGWPYALHLCKWPAAVPIWTGSCPCQPFSSANTQGKGQNDSRHLWPHFSWLIDECHPPIIVGEQVADAINWGWWDHAARDLERSGYSVGATILQADAFGADHRRRRLYWVAHSNSSGLERLEPRHQLSLTTLEAQPIGRYQLASARRALEGDFRGLVPDDGVSVTVERCATEAYGNSIVPQVAAGFIILAVQALLKGHLDSLSKRPLGDTE